jgi:transposase
VGRLKQRFGLSRVVLVGDRGMITSARVKEDLAPAGLDWITCLRASAIKALAEDGGPLQLSLFDERDLAEISAPDMFPGERLIVCRNRDLATERARKREELLVATERELARLQEQVCRKGSRLKSAAQIGMAVGAVLNRKKMAKHFDVEVADGSLCWSRRIEQIAEEERLDGIYVIRTSMPAEHLDAAETVQAYKDLSRVERAFRSLKTVDLEVPPIRHWTAQRVRATVCSYACSPITSSGICAKPWLRSCSMTPTSRRPGQNGPRQLPRPNHPKPPRPKRRPSDPLMVIPS